MKAWVRVGIFMKIGPKTDRDEANILERGEWAEKWLENCIKYFWKEEEQF